ncbi:MAG: DUF2079 domain-containing protein [bacterium]|nr:DUF2079 domain-containing protein [bacterium]
MFLIIKNKIEKNSRLILVGAIFLYFIIFSWLSFKKYQGFDYNSFDLAIFNQVFFNTSQGRLFDLTINLHNYLGDHFEPMILLLLPLYLTKSSPVTLLFLQSAIIALSAWPLYLIAKKVLSKSSLALLIAILWLLNPFVHSANLYEFHLLAFAPFFFFWTFYFYQQNKFKLFCLFFILSLLVREDISLLLISFAFLSYLDKKNSRWIVFSFILPIIYFFLATNIIGRFSVDGNYQFFAYYSWLGGRTLLGIIFSWLSHPLAVLIHIFNPRNIFNFLLLFLPFLFIPFLKPKYLLIFILPFLEFVLSAAGFNFMVYSTHYVLLFMPAIFIALIYSGKYLLAKGKFFASQYVYNNFGFFKIVFLLSIVYFSIFLSPASHLIFKNYSGEEKNLKNYFIAIVDKNNSVAADLNLLAKLSSRQIVYPIYYSYLGVSQLGKSEFRLPPVDYILMDSEEFINVLVEKDSDAFWIKKTDVLSANWQELMSDYRLVKAQDDMLLWQDKNKTAFSLPFYEQIDKVQREEGADFLADINYQKGEPNILKLTFNKKTDIDDDILIRFYKTDRYFAVPLGYGMWPMSQWSEDKAMVFYYYLSDDVRSFQVFQWSGKNKLGLVKEVFLDLDLKPLSELISL